LNAAARLSPAEQGITSTRTRAIWMAASQGEIGYPQAIVMTTALALAVGFSAKHRADHRYPR
jgi:hypothetical protein